MASNLKLFREEEVHNDWCPGCGDFGILSAIQMALADLAMPPHRVAMFSGIGCSGKTPHFIRTYGVHTLHGRVVPFATGAKLSNPELEIIVVGGDGDGYGIGAGHLIGAGRRNVDMAYIVYNNGVYGLTKGQASPTLKGGLKTKSLPQENINEGINPLAVALSAGYTWIGRAYAFDAKHLKEMIKMAVQHKGAALLDVLQPCPTYNNIHSKDWFAGEDLGTNNPRIYKLEATGYSGVVDNHQDDSEIAAKKGAAFIKMQEWGDKIPIGVFYQENRITFEEKLRKRLPSYATASPSKAVLNQGTKPTTDVGPLLENLRVL
jgi:2-oxoglutarate ferredoxin oxidoreductase subunit beta